MSEHKDGSRESGSLERGLVSIVVGMIAAVLVIVLVERLLRTLYPPEPGASTPLSTATAAVLLGAYAVASLVGGFACSLTFARSRKWPVVITGCMLMVAGSFGVVAVYQPTWFLAASFLTYPMVYLGHLAVQKTA